MRRLAHKPVALAWRQRRSHAPYGAPAAATSSCRTFMNKPYPFPSSYPTFFLLNLTHTTALHQDQRPEIIVPNEREKQYCQSCEGR